MTSTITIQETIDTILRVAKVAQFPDTVDTFKTGDATQPLTGIVTTFLATAEVITNAAELGANLIITHEPTFYNHPDATDWLQADPVYQAKRRLIDEHGISVWRFHDYWHMTKPDGIITGVIDRLGWEADPEASYPHVATIAPTSLADLARQLQAQLGVSGVRVTGPDELVCRRIGMLIGASGGAFQIPALGRDDVDAIICGEINEWETCEYVRDAVFFGRPKGLIVIGHAASEEDGMKYLATWLRPHLPDVPITHVACGDPLRFI